MIWLFNWLGVAVAQAAAPLPYLTPVGTPNARGTGPLDSLIITFTGNIVNLLFLIGGSLAVIYLLWSGIQYITAGGNTDRVKTARQGIINAIIGIIVMMATFAIIRFSTDAASCIDQLGNKSKITTDPKACNEY